MKDTNQTNDNTAGVITEVYHIGVERGRRQTINSIIKGAAFTLCVYVVAWCAKKAFIADCKTLFGNTSKKES